MTAPILSRSMLLSRLRDGTLQHLDYNLVQTTLGPMIEPRTLIRASGAMKNDDVYDSNFTDVVIVSDAERLALGINGWSQWPRVFNTL